MSENMTDTFHPKEMFETNETNKREENASELFELINQLNDDEDNNNDSSDSNDDNQSSCNEENSIESNSNKDSNINGVEKTNIARDELNINVNINERLINQTKSIHQAPIESLIKPIETISINTNGKASSIQTFQNRSEKMNLSLLNKSVQISNKGEEQADLVKDESRNQQQQQQQRQQSLVTRIPRIPGLHKKENMSNSSNLDLMTKAPLQLQSQNIQDASSSSTTTSPTNSLSYKLTHELNKLTQENSRNPRSISKPPGSTSKTSRSMSTNTFDSREDLSEPKFNSDGTRNVKYVVNYKPKASKVKIFSKKVEIKNVSSKIGSLEKAATYVPSGGNVVIENKPVQWNAKAKIGSLDFAAKYIPSGGNVKIESKKLNWSSQSKIGSLKHADYQPGGGNVKIENHKLDFKQKARPRTNTGLVMIEVNQDSYLSNNASQSSSSGNISQQISPQSS